MAYTNSNDYITGAKPMKQPAGAEDVTVVFPLVLATGDLVLNDIGQIGWLPAGCLPVDVRIAGTDMDTGAAAAVWQVGIGNAALTDAAGAVSADAANTLVSTKAADGGGAWGDTGTAVATAFDKSMTRTLANMRAVTATGADRAIVLKLTTAPTTPAAGTIYVELTYRAA